jgi:hypothetical protein
MMGEFFNKAITYVKEHKAVGIIAGVLLLFVLFKKLKGRTTRRRRIRHVATRSHTRRRSIPRSVGMNKATRSTNRIIKSGRHRGKKAWQIKGSPEARRHMANIRRKRTRKLF